jgi:biotin operon repressor
LSGDDFTLIRFNWLDRVRADHSLSPLAFHVAYAIGTYINRDTLDAWPSQERLASDCGISVSGVKKLIVALRNAGHVAIASGQGRRNTSRYRWLISEKGPAQDGFNEKGSYTGPFPDSEKGPGGDQKRVLQVATNSLNELSEYISTEKQVQEVEQAAPRRQWFSLLPDDEGDVETTPSNSKIVPLPPSGRVSAQLELKAAADKPAQVAPVSKARRKVTASNAEAFEQFRAAYPHRPGSNWKRAAEIFDKAIAKGDDPAAIVAGATGYAALCRREGREAKHVKMSETWLNQRGWEAEFGQAAAKPQTAAERTDAEWLAAIERYEFSGAWPAALLGPEPGSVGCRVPPRLLPSAASTAGA